jgi:hypothetical protein
MSRRIKNRKGHSHVSFAKLRNLQWGRQLIDLVLRMIEPLRVYESDCVYRLADAQLVVGNASINRDPMHQDRFTGDKTFDRDIIFPDPSAPYGVRLLMDMRDDEYALLMYSS